MTRAGRRVINLDEGNIIARVRFTLVMTSFLSLRRESFEDQGRRVSPLGRQARGVRAMRLSRGDVLVGCEPHEGTLILLISEKSVENELAMMSFLYQCGNPVKAMRLIEPYAG